MSPIPVQLLPDNRLIVWSIEDSRKLFFNGFFGKPLGVSKPKEDFETPLILDHIEGLYLLRKGVIEVYSTLDESKIVDEQLLDYSRKIMERFDEKLRVYTDLREKGWVVTPGVKYGCDFTVYKEGPGLEHAPFIVQIRKDVEKINASEIVGFGRIATTVHKNFILAILDDSGIKYIEFEWWRP
jgi:tRNA-intron endonuclease